MDNKNNEGWPKMLEDYPWFNCEDCYPIHAYSEFMPAPGVGRKPLGDIDYTMFSKDDPYGWQISEIEEELELKPGIEHAGHQIMNNVIKLGKGLTEHYIHGHGGENLKDNPYWPTELAAKAGTLRHERFLTFLPLMLSRTRDDKGRIIWTFFGNSIDDPEVLFWKNFFTSPGKEIPEARALSFLTEVLSIVFGVKASDHDSLLKAGFRILPCRNSLPSWTEKFSAVKETSFQKIKYLLTFKPFGLLPSEVKDLYFSGRLSLIPYPGSLVFWGMPGYEKLKKTFRLAGQIPLLNLVARKTGIDGIRVAQSGWIHEPKPGKVKIFNEELIKDTFHRTHRWQRFHRFEDELNEAGREIKTVKVLFSTNPDIMGLYDKPLARNSHIWDHKFRLLLDGPRAKRKDIYHAEKTILEGGLFGYRIFFPPMKVGRYDVYLHRLLVAYLPEDSDKPGFLTGKLPGYVTGYHTDDTEMLHPVEMWPRLLRRELYLSAINDFRNGHDHYSHQTTMNIISLLNAWDLQNRKRLPRSYAFRLLNISKHKNLDQWLDELAVHSSSKTSSAKMQDALIQIIEPAYTNILPEPLTFSETSTRHFEENLWNDIRFLAQGEFINKDNADVAQDNSTLALIKKKHRDLEKLGDYLISRHVSAIKEAGMQGSALCGELPFKWQTDFEFPVYGGWIDNQKAKTYERNILVIIPGKNHKEAVVLGDHYDTAFMEDVYETDKGGSGARLSAKGADDNYSATSTLLQAAPLFLKLSKEGKLERDVWLLHLTGEEFPSDCMGARNFSQYLVEKRLRLNTPDGKVTDLSDIKISGVFIMDMIGHNRDNDHDIFQISPGKSSKSLFLALQAHISNEIWNRKLKEWNRNPERKNKRKGKRITRREQIPHIAKILHVNGEVRTWFNPHSSLFNTDGQIFSDTGLPVVLFMENYDINRSGYHDSKDTLENIDLDYGAALAAIAIETVARIASLKEISFDVNVSH